MEEYKVSRRGEGVQTHEAGTASCFVNSGFQLSVLLAFELHILYTSPPFSQIAGIRGLRSS